MAAQKILDLREGAARARLAKALNEARANGADIPEPVFDHRFQKVAEVEELEFFAEAIEKLVSLAAPKPQITPEADSEPVTEQAPPEPPQQPEIVPEVVAPEVAEVVPTPEPVRPAVPMQRKPKAKATDKPKSRK